MKSHESTYLELACNLIIEAHARCSVVRSADRDIKTLMSRYEHEGISFLTITLPTFGQDFERSLDSGLIDSTRFRSFRKRGRIPAFLQGIVSLVFDVTTGRIKDAPNIEAIRVVRQVSYFFKKLELPCSPERVAKTFTGYIRDEHDLSVALAQEDIDYFSNVCDRLWCWLGESDLYRPDKSIPRHGPGATGERITGNGKFSFHTWHRRLEHHFPIDSNAFGTLSALDSKEFDELTLIEEDDELPVRVITVPKTLKAPRIIAIEPVAMQYLQQGLYRLLRGALEGNEITKGHLNFRDQEINRRLALMSSKDGRLSTIDLSSASDRVPRSLALRMFDSNPELRDAIDACRSRTAKLPKEYGDKTIFLNKFASMGSALCFPVESMYFYTLCVAARLRIHDLPVTERNIIKMSREVYVFGDDILVPANETETVISFLQKYFCKVNATKSFWTGKFRESCGADCYDGELVTPVYLRQACPDDRHSAKALVSWVETGNLLFGAGYPQTSALLFKRCERILGALPNVANECSGLGRVTYGRPTYERWNKRFQHPEVRTWVVGPVYKKDEIEGYAALLKIFLLHAARSEEEVSHDNLLEWCASITSIDPDHLSRTARYGAVTLKRRWVRPF